MPEINWGSKKRNMNRRVDTYSIPGVSQIIYKNEWGRKTNRRTNNYSDSDNPNTILIFIMFLGIIASIYIILSIN